MSLGINSLAPFFAKASVRQRRIGWNMSSMASVMVAYFFLGCPPRVTRTTHLPVSAHPKLSLLLALVALGSSSALRGGPIFSHNGHTCHPQTQLVVGCNLFEAGPQLFPDTGLRPFKVL